MNRLKLIFKYFYYICFKNPNPMKKLLPLITLLWLLWLHSTAQNNPDLKRTYHWYFGNNAGLDFSSGTPVPITNSTMTAEEGCASISDTCGNLLFYTDGDTVWNRINNVMPNGIGLMGCWSSTQNSLIIPQPGNDSLYYIFLTDCGENSGANGLRYSIINMNLNGGLGEVTQKNTLLFAPTLEKLTATYHANGTDVWILSVNRYPGGPPPDTTHQYYAYLLTTTGVNSTPIISSSLMKPHKVADAYMCFSHSGNKLANRWHSWTDTTELLNFNKLTGKLFNPIIIADTSDQAANGVTFSPDDTKLYCSGATNDSTIYVQYDISSEIQAVINASRIIVKSYDFNSAPGAMQTGSGDGKVYVANANLNSFIDVIQNPNATGLSCNYSSNALDVFTIQFGVGLPNFVSDYLYGDWQPPCNSSVSETSIENDILIYPNPTHGVFTVYSLLDFQRIEIINSIGKMIYTENLCSKEQIINIEKSGRGIYFIKIKQRNNFSTYKIIVY